MCKVKVIEYEEKDIVPVQCKCKDCTERYIGCHSKCESYIKFNEYRKQVCIRNQQHSSIIEYYKHKR